MAGGVPLAGIGGMITSATVTVANLQKWSLSIKADKKDTTAFQATGDWMTQLPTIKSWTASAEGNLDPTDTTGQVALLNGLGNTFAVTFNTDPTLHKWAGSAILTGIDPAADATGLVTIKFAFEGSGAIAWS